MVRKMSKGLLSFIIVFFLICGMLVTGKISVDVEAAGGPIKVKIASVERLYTDSKRVLDMINEYREESNVSTISMDKTYLEAAMVRAAELSLYVSDYCPNGQHGTARITSASGGAQIISYDVRSMYAMLESFKSDSRSDNIILSGAYKSIGIGVVNVNGYKFVCILTSAKEPEHVSDSELSQITEVDQEISVLPDLLVNMKSVYSDDTGVSCGSSIPAYVSVTNSTYTVVNVYLTSYNATVTLSDSQVFKHDNERLTALSPGVCQVKIAYPGSSSLYVSFRLKSIGKNLLDCKFPTIPDQLYTGNQIKPNIVITDKNGSRLVKDTDYTLTYKNNVNVGTATVTVTGAGNYAGQSKDLHFNIIKGNDDPSKSFSISLITSASELLVNDSVTMSVTKTGGVSPYKYTYMYAPYGTSNWTTMISGTTATLYSFKPTASGKYYLRVNGVDGNGLNASKTVVVQVYNAMTLKASLSASTVSKNDVVKITASATGGKAPIQYGYYVLYPNASNWVTIKDYSDSQNASFSPPTTGTYKICVKLKGGIGSVVKKTMTLVVNASTLKNVSAVSSKEIDLGQTISIKGKALNGTSVTYAYYYKTVSEENWHTISNYTTNTLVSFKPSSAGSYDLYVKAKDGSGNIAKATFTVKVHKALTNTSKMSAGVIFLGKSASFTFSAINGSGSYQYAAYCKKGSESEYKLLRDYSTTTSYTFKPDAKGNYYFKIKVKDSIGNVVTKEFSLKVQVPLSMSASISSSSIKSGQSVTVTASASGGSSPYTMAIYYKKPGSSSFIKNSDYESSKTRTLKLSTKGTFTIRVKIKDNAGNIASKDFSVKVS